MYQVLKRIWSRVVDQSDPFLDFAFSFPAEGKTIKVHRSFLLARSQFYKNKFLSGLSDASVQSAEISDFSFAAFHAFLEFLYMENTVVTPETFGELLRLSDFYVVPELGVWLSGRITTDSFLPAIEAAWAINHPIVLEKARCMTPKTVTHLSQHQFAGISQDALECILGWLGFVTRKCCPLLAMWALANGEEAKKAAQDLAISKLDWKRMTLPDFQKGVVPLGFLAGDAIKEIEPKLIIPRDFSEIHLAAPKHKISTPQSIPKIALDPHENVVYLGYNNGLSVLDSHTYELLKKSDITNAVPSFASNNSGPVVEVYELAASSCGTILAILSSDEDGIFELSKSGENLGVLIGGIYSSMAVDSVQKRIYVLKEYEDDYESAQLENSEIHSFLEDGTPVALYKLADLQGKTIGVVTGLALDAERGILHVSNKSGFFQYSVLDMSCVRQIYNQSMGRIVAVDCSTGVVMSTMQGRHAFFTPQGEKLGEIDDICPVFGPNQELFICKRISEKEHEIWVY